MSEPTGPGKLTDDKAGEQDEEVASEPTKVRGLRRVRFADESKDVSGELRTDQGNPPSVAAGAPPPPPPLPSAPSAQQVGVGGPGAAQPSSAIPKPTSRPRAQALSARSAGLMGYVEKKNEDTAQLAVVAAQAQVTLTGQPAQPAQPAQSAQVQAGEQETEALLEQDVDADLDEDQDQDEELGAGITLDGQTAGHTADLTEEDTREEALSVTTARLYADKGKLDAKVLSEKVDLALAAMPQRIDGFGEPQDIMSDDHYKVYKSIENPFEALGKKLQESNPQKAFEMLQFLIQGAKRDCVDLPEGATEPSTEAKAKLKALEEIRDALDLVVTLDYNNIRMRDFSPIIAKINAFMLKTDIPEAQKNLFTTQLARGLKAHQYTEHSVVARGTYYSESKHKEVNRWAHLNKEADRGKHELRLDAESSVHTAGPSKARHVFDKVFHNATSSNYRSIRMSHSEHGKVVHLSFAFDRNKALEGDKYHLSLMKNQCADALYMAMTAYMPPLDKIPPGDKIEDHMKGGEKNPLVFKDRPPELKQPETTLAMLEAAKELAVKEQRPIYVVDPNDPTQKVTVTPDKTYSPEEVALFSKYANEIPTKLKGKPAATAGEIVLGVKPGDTQGLEAKLNERLGEKVEKLEKEVKKSMDNVASEYPVEKKKKANPS